MTIVTIETSRLILKGLSPQTMRYIFEQHTQQEIMCILGHRSEEDYQKELYKHQNGYAAYNRTFLLFLLTHKETGQIIGRCGLHNWNPDHKRAELGYNMADESFRQQGYMSEAVEAILHYGFHTLRLHRIEALVGANNVPSLRIVQKFGFMQEGILREHFCVPGGYEDSVLFSRLEEE